MDLSTSSSDRDSGAGVTGERKPSRAGLRVPPAGGQPNGAFVVVEMVVLVIVAALAMVSIIVSSGGDEDIRAAAQSRLQRLRETGPAMFAGSPIRAERPAASVSSR